MFYVRSRRGRHVKFENAEKVSNQVGGDQNIAGSQYYGPVNYINSGSIDAGSREERLDQEILTSLAFPEMLDRRNNIEPAHPDTCQWILQLEDFKTWKANSRGLLFIKGKPGSGKSTLMKFLYDNFERYRIDKHIICLEFFFSSRGTKLQRTPEGMLRSLLGQLFDQSIECRLQIRDIYVKRQKAMGHSHQWEWKRPDLEKILLNAIAEVAQHQPVGVFVDALDEAGESAAREVAKYFGKISEKIAAKLVTAKICISSRHYPVMSIHGCIEVCVENHNTNDIIRYINETLQLKDLINEKGQDYLNWQRLRDEIIERAQGLFQWVRLVVDLIDRDIHRGRSVRSIQDRLWHVPSGLDQVYRHILYEVIDVEDRHQSLLFFQWLCVAKHPLSVKEMRYALVTTDPEAGPNLQRCSENDDFVTDDEHMKRRIRALSGGLAETVETQSDYPDQSVVQAIHGTVLEFLARQGLNILVKLYAETISTALPTLVSDFSMTIRHCHTEIYRRCLIYLAMEDFVEDRVECSPTPGEIRPIWKDWPLCWYCISFLFEHASEATVPRFTDINQEIELLEKVVRKWPPELWSQCRTKFAIQPGMKLLHFISQTSLNDLAEPLMITSTNVNAKDLFGGTPLHYAANSGQLFFMSKLISHGADINASTTRMGQTALFLLSRSQSPELSLWLIAKGVNVNCVNKDGRSPLILALERNDFCMVCALINAGADVNIGYGKHGYALSEASRFGHMEMIKLLLDAGADVDAQSPVHKRTALWFASFYAHRAAVQLLLRAGANPELESTGRSDVSYAIEAASWSGSFGVVWDLLKAGAQVNARSHTSGTALQIAARYGSEAMLLLLLFAGADPNATGGSFGNALRAAVAQQRWQIAHVLIQAGADVIARFGLEGSGLVQAVLNDDVRMVEILLEAGALDVIKALEALLEKGLIRVVEDPADESTPHKPEDTEITQSDTMEEVSWEAKTEEIKAFILSTLRYECVDQDDQQNDQQDDQDDKDNSEENRPTSRQNSM